jgi:Trk-type K+ transport system membrane component
MVLQWLSVHWVDLCAVIGGIGYLILERFRHPTRVPFFSRDTAIDFVTGLAIAPLALLFFAPFFQSIMNALMRANPLTLAIASIIALFVLLEDRDKSG